MLNLEIILSKNSDVAIPNLTTLVTHDTSRPFILTFRHGFSNGVLDLYYDQICDRRIRHQK